MRFYAKLPSQVVALSLVACLVVVGAPALVSIIDDSMQSEQMFSLGSHVEDDLSDYNEPWIAVKADTPQDADMTYSYIPGSTNNGTHVFSLNTLENKTYVREMTGFAIDNSMFDAGVSRIVLNFSGSDVSHVRLYIMVPGVTPSFVDFVEILDADGVGTNSWVCDLDSYSLTKIKANDISPYIRLYFSDGFSGVFEMTSETYMFTTIPYGEIIIGISGIVLMLCALFATPWFGVKGYTGKKFWRR